MRRDSAFLPWPRGVRMKMNSKADVRSSSRFELGSVALLSALLSCWLTACGEPPAPHAPAASPDALAMSEPAGSSSVTPLPDADASSPDPRGATGDAPSDPTT